MDRVLQQVQNRILPANDLGDLHIIPSLPLQQIKIVLPESVQVVLAWSGSGGRGAGHVPGGVEGRNRDQRDEEVFCFWVVVDVELLLMGAWQ